MNPTKLHLQYVEYISFSPYTTYQNTEGIFIIDFIIDTKYWKRKMNETIKVRKVRLIFI